MENWDRFKINPEFIKMNKINHDIPSDSKISYLSRLKLDEFELLSKIVFTEEEVHRKGLFDDLGRNGRTCWTRVDLEVIWSIVRSNELEERIANFKSSTGMEPLAPSRDSTYLKELINRIVFIQTIEGRAKEYTLGNNKFDQTIYSRAYSIINELNINKRRQLFYEWFGNSPRTPKSRIKEAIPDKVLFNIASNIVYQKNYTGAVESFEKWTDGWDIPDHKLRKLIDIIEESSFERRKIQFNDWFGEEPRLATELGMKEPESSAEPGTTESPEEETKMDKKSTLSVAKSAAKLGIQQAAASQAGDIALDAMLEAMPALKPFSENESSRDLLKAVSAIALSYLAEISDFEHADKVQAVSELIITVSAQRLTADKLKMFTPALKKLASLDMPDRFGGTKDL